MKSQENIDEPQARYCATDIIILCDRVNPHVMVNKKVLVPNRDPREQEQGRPHFKTDHHIKDSQPTVHARFLRGDTSGTRSGLRVRQSFHDNPFRPLSGKSSGGS